MSFYSEFYVVEKTILLAVTLKVGGESMIKIEALREEFADRPAYCTHAYIQESVSLQPSYPADNNGPVNPPERYRTWVSYELPWTRGDSADAVLQRALSFLSERCEQ